MAHYRPLRSPREMRVLKLYPGKPSDPIRCELENITGRDAHSTGYVALSYTWGDPKNTKEILLDDYNVPVTANLYAFLQHAQALLFRIKACMPAEFFALTPPLWQRLLARMLVRMPTGSFLLPDRELRRLAEIHLKAAVEGATNLTSEMETWAWEDDQSTLETSSTSQTATSVCFRLWIDALCINQSDAEEKAKQIPLMGEIYRHAIMTLIWLGDYHTMPIDTISSCFKQLEEGYEWMQQDDSIDPSWCRSVLRVPIAEKQNAVSGIIKIFQLPWFGRAWVFQEAVVSSLSFVMIGLHHLRFTKFEGLFHPSNVSSENLQPVATISVFNSTIEWYKRRRERPDKDQSGSSFDIATTLDKLLRKCGGHFVATDPRDLFYSLLGILDVKQLPECIMPNYALTFESVFRNYTAFLVEETGALDYFCDSSETLPGEPTWVPDWRSLPLRGRLPKAVTRKAKLLSESRTVLEVEGVRLGLISDLINPMHNSFDWIRKKARDEGVTPEKYDKLDKDAFQKLATQALTAVVHQFCIEAGISRDEDSTAGEMSRIMENYREYENYGAHETEYENLTVSSTRLPWKQFSSPGLSDEGILMMNEGSFGILFPRSGFFAKRGDEIVMLKGALVPYILEQAGAEYQVKGSCILGCLNTDPDEEFYLKHHVERIRLI